MSMKEFKVNISLELQSININIINI